MPLITQAQVNCHTLFPKSRRSLSLPPALSNLLSLSHSQVRATMTTSIITQDAPLRKCLTSPPHGSRLIIQLERRVSSSTRGNILERTTSRHRGDNVSASVPAPGARNSSTGRRRRCSTSPARNSVNYQRPRWAENPEQKRTKWTSPGRT